MPKKRQDFTRMIKTVMLGDFLLHYELERKSVKNINLRIRPDGTVAVSAPKRLPMAYVESFLKDNGERIKAAVMRAEKRAVPKLADGIMIPVLGREYRLCILQGSKNRAELSGDELRLSLKNAGDEELLQKTLDGFYKELCREHMEEICRRIYPSVSAWAGQYPQLRFRRMKSRWGSCMPKKCVVTFNSLLAMTPLVCMEYVAAHEFCHFIHPDHSKAFYASLERMVPQWRGIKKLLDSYGPWLT